MILLKASIHQGREEKGGKKVERSKNEETQRSLDGLNGM